MRRFYLLYAVCDFDTGATAKIEFHASYGHIRFTDSSCGLHVPSSSRDSLLPHISDSGGGQQGQGILRYRLHGETSTLSTSLLEVMPLPP